MSTEATRRFGDIGKAAAAVVAIQSRCGALAEHAVDEEEVEITVAIEIGPA